MKWRVWARLELGKGARWQPSHALTYSAAVLLLRRYRRQGIPVRDRLEEFGPALPGRVSRRSPRSRSSNPRQLGLLT
jgi:hypothetical protein